MPSIHSYDISKLCRHESWRVGCLSCKQHHTKRQKDEARAKRDRTQEHLNTFDALIRNETSKDERQRLKDEKKESQNRQNALHNLVLSLEAALSSTVQEVKNICAENEPDMLSDAFEQDAAVREQELLDIWRAGASAPEEMEFPKFKTENPSRKSSFKGLDRTKIPANPDYLINNPIGLEIFLRLAKNRTPSNPMSAVGLSPGPAFMSYGRAVAEFGEPEAPGADWSSEDEIDTAPQISSAPSAESAPPLPQLSWALFKESSFLKYTSLLVAEYAKLVRGKSS